VGEVNINDFFLLKYYCIVKMPFLQFVFKKVVIEKRSDI